MFDRDIRPPLVRAIREGHPNAILFEEFPVCRKGRADLVAVNASLWGFEIKSERDSLNRLPLQVEQYDSIFDFCTIVAAECHLTIAKKIVPRHWGILAATGSSEMCEVIEKRAPEQNPNRKMEHVVRLLWKNEGLKTLRARGLSLASDTPVRTVWKILGKLPTADLDESVRSALKSRRKFQADSPRMLSDD